MTVKADPNNLLLFATKTFINIKLNFTSVEYLVSKEKN